MDYYFDYYYSNVVYSARGISLDREDNKLYGVKVGKGGSALFNVYDTSFCLTFSQGYLLPVTQEGAFQSYKNVYDTYNFYWEDKILTNSWKKKTEFYPVSSIGAVRLQARYLGTELALPEMEFEEFKEEFLRI